MVGDVRDVIRVPSFKLKSPWVTILQGVEFSIFVLILAWALQQCSATALPVIVVTQTHIGLHTHTQVTQQENETEEEERKKNKLLLLNKTIMTGVSLRTNCKDILQS